MDRETTIETVISLIETGKIDRAVAAWASMRKAGEHCSPCFFSPLDDNTRCASCLESNLSKALLSRGYTSIPRDRLEGARRTIMDWSKSVSVLAETA